MFGLAQIKRFAKKFFAMGQNRKLGEFEKIPVTADGDTLMSRAAHIYD